jgi:hypothetical protein
VSERRVTVWRYETVDGRGPYNGPTWERQSVMSGHHLDSMHPSWASDDLDGCRFSDYRSGCPSRKALMTWFEGYHNDLKAAGFKIMSYRVPLERVREGYSGQQVAFIKGAVKGVMHP